MGSSCSERLRVGNVYVRVFIAELIGTAILIIYGDGSVAQSVLSKKAYGEQLSVNWCWCMGVVFGVFSCISVSGGHINPAISLAMAIIGRLEWRKLPVYMLAQYIGAFIGAAVVCGVYYEAIEAFDGGVRSVIGPNATAGIFATYPSAHLSIGGAVVDQIVGTAMLSLSVMAVTDKRNALPQYLVPVLVGFAVLVIGAAYGFNCGYAINPARDLGPRVFTAVAGYGTEVFSAYNYYFWVPAVIPHVGAIIGALIYLVGVEYHHPVEHSITDDTTDEKIAQFSYANTNAQGNAQEHTVPGEEQML